MLACYPASPLWGTGIISQKELFLLKVALVMIVHHRNRTVANTWSYNTSSLLSTCLDLKSPRWDSSGCAWGCSHVPEKEDGEWYIVMGWGPRINQRTKYKMVHRTGHSPFSISHYLQMQARPFCHRHQPFPPPCLPCCNGLHSLPRVSGPFTLQQDGVIYQCIGSFSLPSRLHVGHVSQSKPLLFGVALFSYFVPATLKVTNIGL